MYIYLNHSSVHRKLTHCKLESESELAQLCLTLCDPMDCSPPRLLGPWDFPGMNPGGGCHFLLQGIFPTQVSSPGLPHYRHYRQTLYRLSNQELPNSGVWARIWAENGLSFTSNILRKHFNLNVF